VFKDFIADKYDKEEFLIDAGFEFYKIKKLLTKNPKLLKDDPILSIDYFKIINMIKRKKLLEDTSDPFASHEQASA
jgi:dihydropteroate synthase